MRYLDSVQFEKCCLIDRGEVLGLGGRMSRYEERCLKECGFAKERLEVRTC